MVNEFFNENKGSQFLNEIDNALGNDKEGQSSIKFSTNTKGFISFEVKVYRGDSEDQLTALRDKSFKLLNDVKSKVDALNINKE